MAILLMIAGPCYAYASEGSSNSCFPRGHKDYFKIVVVLITSRICSKLRVNKLLRIMIFAYVQTIYILSGKSFHFAQKKVKH